MSGSRVFTYIFLLLLCLPLKCYAVNISLHHITFRERKDRYLRVAEKIFLRFGTDALKPLIRNDRRQRTLETSNDSFSYLFIPRMPRRKNRVFSSSPPLFKIGDLILEEDLRVRYRLSSFGRYTANTFRIPTKYEIKTKLKLKIALGSKAIKSAQVRLIQQIIGQESKFTFQIRAKYRVRNDNLVVAWSLKWDF